MLWTTRGQGIQVHPVHNLGLHADIAHTSISTP